jgi:hypothetical protein
MNMLLLVGMASTGAGNANPGWMDSCALCLFIAGFASLAAGAYLTYKTSPMRPIRVHRRLD